MNDCGNRAKARRHYRKKVSGMEKGRKNGAQGI
jgi:predicted RNA-binding Zn ribbon-like protein